MGGCSRLHHYCEFAFVEQTRRVKDGASRFTVLYEPCDGFHVHARHVRRGEKTSTRRCLQLEVPIDSHRRASRFS